MFKLFKSMAAMSLAAVIAVASCIVHVSASAPAIAIDSVDGDTEFGTETEERAEQGTVIITAGDGGSVSVKGEDGSTLVKAGSGSSESVKAAVGSSIKVIALADKGYTVGSFRRSVSGQGAMDSQNGAGLSRMRKEFSVVKGTQFIEVSFKEKAESETEESLSSEAETATETIDREITPAEEETIPEETVRETIQETIKESLEETASEETLKETEPAAILETNISDISPEDAREAVTDVVAETYLKENVSGKFVPSIDKMELASGMVVKQTLADRAVTGDNATIESVMLSTDKVEKLITQFDFAVALYDLSDSSDYYVGYANTMLYDAGAIVSDWAFAENNNSGVGLDGCVYDRSTGIAYVPKKLTMREDGAVLVGYVQLQLLQLMDYESGENVESMAVSNSTVEDENSVCSEADGIFDFTTTVQVGEGLDTDTMEIAVNGVPISEEEYCYDSESGELDILRSSASVGTVSIQAEEETFFTKIKKFFSPFKVAAAKPSTAASSTGSAVVELADGVGVGSVMQGTSDIFYSPTGSGAGLGDSYLLESVPTEAGLLALANRIISGTDGLTRDTELYKANDGLEFFWVFLSSIELSGANEDKLSFGKLPEDTRVALKCAHVGTTLVAGSGTMIHDYSSMPEGSNLPAGGDYRRNAGIAVRVLYVNREGSEPYALLGVVTTKMNDQTGVGLVKVRIAEGMGKLKIKKVSDNSAKIEKYGADAYDRSAVYGVYETQDAAKSKDKDKRVTILRTKPDGFSNKVALEPGNYWLREISTSGQGFFVSDEIKKVVIREGEITTLFDSSGQCKEPTCVPIRVHKSISNPELIPGGVDYSQAVYGLYWDAACTDAVGMGADGKNPVTFTLKDSGYSDWVWLSDSKDVQKRRPGGYGTYYVKEISAPPGLALDATVHEFNMGKDTLDLTIESQEPIQSLPGLNVTIKKKVTEAHSKTDKSTQGCIFKVEYFANYACAGTPARVWYFASQTLRDSSDPSLSFVRFDAPWFDHGDALFVYNGRTVIPLGSIRISEETAAPGFKKTDQVLTGTITVPEGNTSQSAVITLNGTTGFECELDVPNDVKFAGLAVHKVDKCVYAFGGNSIPEGGAEPQGDASLEGAVFAVYNANDYDVVRKEDGAEDCPSFGPGAEVVRIETDEFGVARTPVVQEGVKTKQVLQLDSSYRVVEIDPSTGMKVNDGFDETVKLPDIEDHVYGEAGEEQGTLLCEEDVKRGDVQIQKFDKELHKSEAIAGKDHGIVPDVPNLEGISFEIRNVSKKPIFLYGDPEQRVSNEPGDNLCMTITTHWNPEENAYTAETTGKALPYGTYSIQEVTTNETYLLTDGLAKTFAIREDGSIVKADGDGENLVFGNYVIREDLLFNKIANLSSRRLQTAWALENTVTGEKHAIVTDKNGVFDSSSSRNKHSFRTNTNDALLEYEDTDHIITADEMDATAGVWFGLAEDESIAPADDRLRALPYGFYELRELRCEDNDGFDLQTISFWVGGRRANDYSDAHAVIDLGTITDHNNPAITTTASGKDTGKGIAKAGKDTVVIDTVHCTGLDKGSVYRLRASIRDYEDEGSAFKVDGRFVRAEKEFTATAASMDVEVELAFDATEYAGSVGVVYEELYKGDVKVCEHTDIDDEEQRVIFPGLQTTAVCEETGNGIGVIRDGKIVIKDTVAYEGLIPGKEAVIRGSIYDKSTGSLVGESVEQVFTPDKASGTLELVFEIQAESIAGAELVAFEKLYYGEVEIADHSDPEDEGQTVSFPSIRTTAKDGTTGTNEGFAGKEAVIVDTVEYVDLKPGIEVTVRGTLIDKETGSPVEVDGKPVTAEKTFVADEKNGAVDVEFAFDASGLAGRSLVVFETLYYGDTEIASHADVSDEGQTIHYPDVKTNAVDKDTGLHDALAKEKVTITDRVALKNLTVGKTYVVSGTLMDKETGEPLIADGEKVTAEKEFVAEAKDVSVELEFVFNASALAGKTVVAFEDLHQDGKLVGTHTDLESKEQTVYFPKVGTKAIDKESGLNEGAAGKKTVIVDTVAYSNLEPGASYSLKGVLMDKASGREFFNNGKAVTSELNFTVSASKEDRTSGTIDLEFVFDSSELKGKEVVVFERLYREGKEVAVHTDIEDEGQTVHYPGLKTTATDKITGTHEQLADKKATIVDVVKYSGLTPGKEYVMKGVLMDKSTKKPLGVDGAAAEKKFTPKKADGEITLEFTFDSSVLEGKTLVVFEDLYRDGKLVGVHENLEDKDQSVNVLKIKTEAKDGSTKSGTLTIGEKVTVVDTVSYNGLSKGKKYRLKGTLYDKETGKPLEIGGKGVTAESSFRAKSAKGTAEVTFSLDTRELAGKTLVVFEELYDSKDKLIAAHKDLRDKAQTVTVPTSVVQTISPKTGDETGIVEHLASILFALVLLIVCWRATRSLGKWL